VLCPTCHSINPDGNRFCGNCGASLDKHAHRKDELPRELIEFDRKIPLIAEPGSDRRNMVPENIREQVREVVERDRKRESERNRDAEVERELESQRFAVVPSAGEDRKVKLPSGFLGLNTEDDVAEEKVAPVMAASVTEPPRANSRGSNNSFWNLEEAPRVSVGGVSGPSFLGLSDSPEDVEQDEPEGHARRNVALVVLLLLIGLGATQWHQIRDQALPFVKNGTQEVLLKVKGKQAQPASDDSSNASNANENAGSPNIEVAPTNDNLKKAEPPANSAASNSPATTPSATSETTSSTPASNSAAEANAPATTGGVTGAATNAAGEANDVSKPADDVATKTAGGKKSAADETETATADEETAAPAKESTKKSADTVARKGKKPSAADRPQIEEDQPQAGSAELAMANAAGDPTRQRQLLWQAVKKGNPDASVKLAELYIMGRGVEKSCDQAMVLLRSASVHASSRARGKLGAMYATGECVPQDRVQAYHWMSMALQANPNSDWTERYRESIWNQMTANEKVLAKKDR
jgi:hypothetical protein